MIFGTLNLEKISDENLTHLSTSLVRCSHFTLGNPKKSFSAVLFIRTSDCLRYLKRKQTVIHLPTPPENFTTVTCEMQNVFIWLLRSFNRWRLWREPQLWVVIGGSEKNRLWCVATGMSGKQFHSKCSEWPTFCINTCFQSFSTLINRIVHHAVLKFSPRRNKLPPQASTRPYQYTRSSCSTPQTQYYGYSDVIGSTKQH